MITWLTCVAKNASVEINLQCIFISDKLWGKITDTQCLKDLLPSERTDRLVRQRGHDYIIPRIRTERFKRSFVNRCIFNFIQLNACQKNCIRLINFSFIAL